RSEIDAGPLTAPSRRPAPRVRPAVLRLSSWRRGAMCRTLTTGASGPFTVSVWGQPGRQPSKPRAPEGGGKTQEGRGGTARGGRARGAAARATRPQPPASRSRRPSLPEPYDGSGVLRVAAGQQSRSDRQAR
ncbi:Hypothetical predicted protein, partial [Marmota monax]